MRVLWRLSRRPLITLALLGVACGAPPQARPALPPFTWHVETPLTTTTAPGPSAAPALELAAEVRAAPPPPAVSPAAPQAPEAPVSTEAPARAAMVPETAPAITRRVGIQAGHWLTKQAPDELAAIRSNTGAESGGVQEATINLDMAKRVAAILGANGVAVDILPVTIPSGYLADAFVSLHMDSDPKGVKTGFKSAHSARRSPLEDRLQALVEKSFGAATGLAYDATGITANMTSYYAMNWRRFKNATSPFTPSLVLEMGFVTSAHDRGLMLKQGDLVARAIADGILGFLTENPREKIYGVSVPGATRPG